jgi:hypothetical protein
VTASKVVDLFLNKEIVNAVKTCNKVSRPSAWAELTNPPRLGRGRFAIISFVGSFVGVFVEFKSITTRICSSVEQKLLFACQKVSPFVQAGISSEY